MLRLLAHGDAVLEPHDLAGAWNLDPLLLLAVAGAVACHRRGWRPADGRARRAAFHAALVVLLVALVSPLDAASGALASAHMVQHVLLLAVVGPLLAWSAPLAPLSRGLPSGMRRWPRAVRSATGISVAVLRGSRAPVLRWVAYVAVLWVWHAAVLYGAAVEHEPVHLLEHTSFLAAAVLAWSPVLGPARARVPPGLGVLYVFALSMQSVFLAALLTFATSPWYEPYVDVAPAWGVDALRDQQLAGVVMWVPAGLVHTGIGIWLLVRWLAEIERAGIAAPRRRVEGRA